MVSGLSGVPGVLALSRVVVAANDHDHERVQTQHQPMVDNNVLDRVQRHGLVLQMHVLHVCLIVAQFNTILSNNNQF